MPDAVSGPPKDSLTEVALSDYLRKNLPAEPFGTADIHPPISRMLDQEIFAARCKRQHLMRTRNGIEQSITVELSRERRAQMLKESQPPAPPSHSTPGSAHRCGEAFQQIQAILGGLNEDERGRVRTAFRALS